MATINVIGKSDRELVELFGTDPGKLTADEMLYVATLTDDNAKKMGIYKKSTEFFPNDYRTFNNLGNDPVRGRRLQGRAVVFPKALALNPQSKEAEMNMGLVALLEGRYSNANATIGQASGLPEAADALGVYYLTQGETSKALNAFGSAKTNNAALCP